MKRNQTTLVLGAAALASYFIYKKYRGSSFATRGVWTDLATKQGIAIGNGLSVQEAQLYLNSINNQTSPAYGGKGLLEDGVLGRWTIAAIKKFQAGNGLPATGALDDETSNALSYFAAATSKSGALKKYAAVSPDTISSLSSSLPSSRRPLSKSLASAVDIGGGWVMYGNCGCRWDDAACAARCGGTMPTMSPPTMSPSGMPTSKHGVADWGVTASGDFRTGIQSTSMYVARSTYTDPFGNAIDGNVSGYGWE